MVSPNRLELTGETNIVDDPEMLTHASVALVAATAVLIACGTPPPAFSPTPTVTKCPDGMTAVQAPGQPGDICVSQWMATYAFCLRSNNLKTVESGGDSSTQQEAKVQLSAEALSATAEAKARAEAKVKLKAIYKDGDIAKDFEQSCKDGADKGTNSRSALPTVPNPELSK